MGQLAILGGKPVRERPFPSWPVFDDSEERALVNVLRSGKWWRYSYGEGLELREREDSQSRSRVAEFQEAFARFQGAKYGVGCANGTAAIEVALKALGIGPGDEVIVPPYTFIATASAVLMNNAVPIFADIDLETFNMSPPQAEKAITPSTRAIIVVHFAGHAADMGAFQQIAARHNLILIEDAAHAHGGAWNGRGLGSIGHAGTFSFQASKNMTAGEGGLITVSDKDLAIKCESYMWAGRDFDRPWYEHHRLGWNYRMTEFQGAILIEQLKRIAAQNATRHQNAVYLNRRLAEIHGIRPLAQRDYATSHSHHIYIFRFDQSVFGISRDEFLTALEAEGIPCSGGYAHPIYKNPMFLHQDFYPRGCPLACGHYNHTIDYASFADTCPNAERACEEAVWLEHRLLLGEQADMEDVVRAVAKIYERRGDFRARRAGGHN
ncbi:MAG: DegT/DnrJ/EryC1/StrS family aminotransferase [Acidobacteria bacterium]|nr:MAG: DegT/DnrJ/EryC1/StrS family aminotransferase [Acidobacteriota bacterium]